LTIRDFSAITGSVQPGRVEDQVAMAGDLSNREFLELHARVGRIGLSRGATLIGHAIRQAERRVAEDNRPGSWSHAFLFQGLRPDGHHWVVESDLQAHRKHIQFGAQENRISKYYDEKLYTSLAVLDFGLTEAQASLVVGAALELVAERARYSLRELLGTLIAMHQPGGRAGANPLARKKSMFCSAFVHHIFRRHGLDLAPGLDPKNSTPEDIARTKVPHVTYLLQRKAGRRVWRTQLGRELGLRLEHFKSRQVMRIQG
jgi:hypothetical protein